MAELSLVFRRILSENESDGAIEASLDNMLVEGVSIPTTPTPLQPGEYEGYEDDYYAFGGSLANYDSNNVYINMINTLKAKIDYFENKNEYDKDEENVESDEMDLLYREYMNNVDNIKMKIKSQFEILKATEEKYNTNLNQLKNMNKILIDLGDVKYTSSNDDVKKVSDEFKMSLNKYISTIEDDQSMEEMHKQYLKEMRKFKKYTSMASLLTEVYQIPVCILCMDNVPMYTFECGHVCCDKCLPKLSNVGKCHTCRGPIDKKIKLYLFN